MKNVKEMIKISGTLTLIIAVSAALLAVVDSFTKGPIEDNVKEAYKQSLAAVTPDGFTIGDKIDSAMSKTVESSKSVEAYMPLKDENGEVSGYILELTGKGFAGKLQIFCSYDNAGEVLLAKMGANEETAGYGKRAEEDGYMDMFYGFGNVKDVPLNKDGVAAEYAPLVSGATITFTGLSKAVKGGSDFVKKSLPEKSEAEAANE